MTTIVEALQNATDALNAATQGVLTFKAGVQAQLAANVSQSQTIINNFLARPGVATYFVDPVNGNDANDGQSTAFPKKNVETILAAMQNTTTGIFLMNDYTFTKRTQLSASVTFTGIQQANNSPGFIFQQRTLRMQGAATNSPNPIIGTFASGIWFDGPHLTTAYVNVELCDVDPTSGDQAMFSTSSGASFTFGNLTLTGDSPNAGYLVESSLGKSLVYGAMAFGVNAAGHVFAGVAAGDNPNNHFEYESNLTSA